MPHNIAAFKTAQLLTLSAAGTAASAAGISAQLGQTHAFFYLQLPLWIFFTAMVVLTFLGAFISLTTDYMRARGTTASKLTTAIAVGLVVSFVVLPTIIREPSVGLMMVTSFFGGLSGTILTYVCMRLLNNKELQDAVIDLIAQRAVKFLGVALDLITEHATKLLTIVLTSVVASFVVLPQLKAELNASLVSNPDYQEVLNVKHG
ncbi:hypothetical protein [Psychrobacter sp. ANT_WB68]|uniref:hypothetical protein n=1 Tax=Psychrobacter sp. ANT_WB68 TaxID=2597355 RepID=UPI0011F31F11|nr:hypothetical protein [Psychrobacter sp. ANT_WB68]KAA0915825.1 hypothetical protein FQ084_04635 [Psychrobacter sp. ANT_WB68]